MIQNKLKQALPYLWPILIFLAVTIIYFYPAFKGFSPRQTDIMNFKGMVQEISEFREQYGEEPYWTNSMFGGMPAFQISARFDNVYKEVADFFRLYLPSPAGLFFMYALGFYILLLVAGCNQWVSAVGAIAFAFSSYFIIIIEAGHVTKARAIGFMAPVFAGVMALYQGRLKLGAALTLLFLSLNLASNHLQITYYLGLTILIYLLFRLYWDWKAGELPRFLKASVVGLLVVVGALLANNANLVNTMRYSEYTTRGPSDLTIRADGSPNDDIETSGLDKEYATDWSYGIEESLTLFIPNAKGGATAQIGADNSELDKADPRFRQNVAQQNQYWGNQRFTSGPVYVGILVFYLFLLALFVVRGPWVWPLLVATVLSLFLGWGKNFMPLTDFFLDYIPGYNKFRAVSMTLVILELTIPLMAFVGLKKLISEPEKWPQRQKTFYYTTGGFALFLVVLAVAPGAFLDFLSDKERLAFANQADQGPQMANTMQMFADSLKAVRVAIFKADVLRSLVFVLLGAGLMWWKLAKKGPLQWFLAGLGLLVMADLWSVNTRYFGTAKEGGRYVNWMPDEQKEYPFTPTSADLQILSSEMSRSPRINQAVKEATADASIYTGLVGNARRKAQAADQFSALNFNSNYRVLNTALSTFNDASTSYFHKSVGGYHGAKLQRFQNLVDFHFAGGINPLVLNMLNTRYIIRNGNQGPVATRNPDALGAAWPVKNVRYVASANEEIQALRDFDPASEVVIQEQFRSQVPEFRFDSSATITQREFLPNRLVYTSVAAAPQFVVFSEIYYPDGWKATIDGEEADILRVNYLLRGIHIPAGKHEIVMTFDPEVVRATNTLGWITGLLSLLAVVAMLWMSVRSRDEAAS